MTTTKEQLISMTKELVKCLEGKISIEERFDDAGSEATSLPELLIDNAYDIEFTVTSEMDLRDFKITTALGGPTIWCDSRFVYGTWGNDRTQIPYKDKIELFVAMQEAVYNNYSSSLVDTMDALFRNWSLFYNSDIYKGES